MLQQFIYKSWIDRKYLVCRLQVNVENNTSILPLLYSGANKLITIHVFLTKEGIHIYIIHAFLVIDVSLNVYNDSYSTKYTSIK